MKKNLGKLLLVGIFSFAIMGMVACGGSTKTTKVIEKIDDLKGAKIGVQQGTTGHLFVEDKYKDDKDTKVEPYNKAADAVAALKKGLIDCVVIDNDPAQVFVNQNKDLKILEEPIETEEYCICVAKNNKDLLSKIDGTLDEMKSDGVLKQILDSYEGSKKIADKAYKPLADNKGENGELIVGTNATFPPYEYYEGDKIVGIDMDIAQAIADKLGMKLKIEDMEFDSILAAVESGKVNLGLAGISYTEERAKSVGFSKPYVDSKQVVIVKNNNK